MKSHGAVAGSSATSYLAGLARMFEQVEVTVGGGAPLPLDEGIARAVDFVLSLKDGGKALLIGNGGSAAIASHLHNDLCKAVGVRAMVFSVLFYAVFTGVSPTTTAITQCFTGRSDSGPSATICSSRSAARANPRTSSGPRRSRPKKDAA